MRSPRLAALELRRFGRGRLPRAALVALLLLPLLYGALYLWSFWDPYGRLDKIPVALVNEDTGAKAKGHKVDAGRQIVRGLRDSDTFDWQETDARHAREGVEDGTYYLSLTLPADLSSRIASNAGDTTGTGTLDVRTNDANNYIVGQISRTVFSEVRSAASTRATRSYLDQIFVSFSDLHDQTRKAAGGADKLKNGSDEAGQGAGRLVSGLADARHGGDKLVRGLDTLGSGAADLASGAGKVADGTGELAGKVNGAAGKLGPFLRENQKSLGDAAGLVADGAGTVRAHLDTLVKAAPKAAREARAASATLDKVYGEQCGARRAGSPAATPSGAPSGAAPSPGGTPSPGTGPACPALAQAKEAAAQVAALSGDLDTLIGERGGAAGLDHDLATLATQARALQKEAPHLADDLDAAVAKINALDKGAKRVADGADRLRTGIGSAHTGARTLDDGLGTLHSGAGDLSTGLHRLSDGSGTLAHGLHTGAGKIPDYGDDDRAAHSGAMADPVRLASHDLHKAPNYGTGFAPYFIPLALWVGAMVAYMLIAPLNRRALATGTGGLRATLASWLPVVALGFAQAGALLAVLHWGIGLDLARPAATVAFLFLVTACFAALVQWLNAQFGAAGRILVLALLMLQLTSAGGTYPVETSPAFFHALHPFLPMSYVVEALRRLVTGGGLGPVWEGCAVLGAFTLGALALTAWRARRAQVWTVERLHPELSL
ncbi:YhgE/Pip family protein [Streptomyces sp. NRRL F-5630]|uniref:YhgE/Pip family protein n=1 Tax=Streptomyces sp. NRRL F-5630 TaxID=1463864 RepID=UPI0004CA1BC2|nr:YhgE/Pip domain-containing protein [Streptomyces sp. NRRL F-5630]